MRTLAVRAVRHLAACSSTRHPAARAAAALVLWALVSAALAPSARGIPVFSRKYRTGCATCHLAYPQLNAFGRAFRNHGYRFPAGDEDARKEEPVSLGSEAYRDLWPEAIWPSDLPANPPLAIHLAGMYERDLRAPDTLGAGRLDVPQEAELLSGGTLGESFSCFAALEAEYDAGRLGVSLPCRLQWDHAAWLHAAVGALRVDPSPGEARLLPGEYNVSTLASRNGWTAQAVRPAVEAWGAGDGPKGRGGWTASAGAITGQGRVNAERDQDVFVRASWKFGGMGEAGGGTRADSAAPAPWLDDHARLSGLYYAGHVAGDTWAGREELRAWALSAEGWTGRLALTAAALGLHSRIAGLPDRRSLAWYVEARYVAYPWLVALSRYESTQPDQGAHATPAALLVNGVALLARANVKFTLELAEQLTGGGRALDSDEPDRELQRLRAKLDFAL